MKRSEGWGGDTEKRKMEERMTKVEVKERRLGRVEGKKGKIGRGKV